MTAEQSLRNAQLARTPVAAIALYARWWQLETWLRQVTYVVLRATWGSEWESEMPQQALRYRDNDSIIHLAGPDSQDLITYLDFGKLLVLISENWDLFEPFLMRKAIWLGRCEELRSIRNSIAHIRRPNDDYLSRIEVTLRDLEPGYRQLIRAFGADYRVQDRTSDPVCESFRAGALKERVDDLRRRFRVDVELGVSEVPPGSAPDAPAPLVHNPHLLWHLNIGGPEYWLSPPSLHRNLSSLARKHLVFALVPSPFGGVFTFPVVDDAANIIGAMQDTMIAFSSSARAMMSLDAEKWPTPEALALDPRLLFGTFDLLAYADDPDESGTLFHV